VKRSLTLAGSGFFLASCSRRCRKDDDKIVESRSEDFTVLSEPELFT
jgi:hypothetical protein